MIKILHICPAGNVMIAQYADMIAKGMSDRVQTALVNEAKSARKKCSEMKPDIVHVHGCEQKELIRVVRMARTQGARVVLTPHGQLQPWTHLAEGNTAIHQCVAHSFALIAQSNMEAKTLGELGWNDRIETIANPIITRTTTARELVGKTYAVYQKVMASDVLELMDKTTRNAMRCMLKAGITGDRRWVETPDTEQVKEEETPETETPDWVKMYVYAEQEGVINTLLLGIKAMGVEAPVPTDMPIYLPNGYKRPEPASQQGAVSLVRTIHDEVDAGTLSLLRLVELDMALRNPLLDEEVLLSELSAARLLKFFGCLLQILSEQTGLDEGFMPCNPIDNKKTKHIRTVITKHLKI